MTRNDCKNNNKSKSFWLTLLLCVLCFSLSMFFVACNNSNTSSTDSDKTYSRVENDTADIKNGSFEFGTYALTSKDYPQTTTSGWSKPVESANVSSSVKSGIVDTSEESWNAIIEKLYNNNSFLSYAKKTYSIPSDASKEDAIEILKEKFTNPSKPVGSQGSKIYMLNNYRTADYYGLGIAQNVTSSSEITIEKGTVGLIKFSVKTFGLVGENNYGATVKLLNKFNSVSQDDYVLQGINTQVNTSKNDANGWATYEIYVKADANYDSNVQVVFGLGLGNGTQNTSDYTEGTVYFDNITFTKVNETDIPSGAITNKFTYKVTADDKISISANSLASADVLLYDMTLTTPVDYIKNVSLVDANVYFTYSDDGKGGQVTSQSYFSDSNFNQSVNSDKISLTNIKNAGITIDIFNSQFKVANESYAYVTFKIENKLSAFDRNGITVYGIDKNGSEELETSVITLTESGEDTICSIMFLNNNETGIDKEFYIKVVVGPNSIKSTLEKKQYANGEISISNLTIATGLSYQYDKVNKTDITPNYNFYSLFSNTANSIIELKAGYESTNDTSADSYFLNVAPVDSGKIVNSPTKINGYVGVTPDHAYIDSTSTNYLSDTRTGNGDNGNFAGLINSKYVDNYETLIPGLKSALSYNDVNSIQPIMIYNSVANSYGYISDVMTIGSREYAQISVKVKVTGNAKAYVYLVDLSKEIKEIVTLDFNQNVNEFGENITQTVSQNKTLAFEGIDSSMMDQNGWLTVNFYIANGVHEKNVRLEVWNGSRDGAQTSQGFTFFGFEAFNSADGFTPTLLTGGFTEVSRWENLFTSSTSVLYGKKNQVIESALYKRELDANEIKFNNQQTDSSKIISYDAKYVWVKTNNIIYAVYNTIDPLVVDPFESDETTDSTGGASCTATTDPATFWMSISSILLAVVLVGAMIMLIIKRFRIRKEANKNDAKSHFKVTSRYTPKSDKKVKSKKDDADYYDEEIETSEEDFVEEVEEEKPAEEKTLDEYVYGDVQDFGEDSTDKE